MTQVPIRPKISSIANAFKKLHCLSTRFVVHLATPNHLLCRVTPYKKRGRDALPVRVDDLVAVSVRVLPRLPGDGYVGAGAEHLLRAAPQAAGPVQAVAPVVAAGVRPLWRGRFTGDLDYVWEVLYIVLLAGATHAYLFFSCLF